MQGVIPSSPCNPYLFLASQQPYIERVLEFFNFCLSPQKLPNNMSARALMDEELWMPIRTLSKLPELDSLHIAEMMIPFIANVLHQYSRDTVEVDLVRKMVRPKWALQSSVFISKVDEKATTEQVYALLDDIRLAVSHHMNPYEYRNISIAKQSPSAWTIAFRSPSAGAYAAMVLRTKCINDTMILPMACVLINPPRASYAHAGIVVMEIDPIRFGTPFIPNEFVPYYSENPQHIDMLYWQTAPYHAAQPYEDIFRTFPNNIWKSGKWAKSNHVEWRGSQQEEGQLRHSDLQVPKLSKFATSGKEMKSRGEPEGHCTNQETASIANCIEKEPNDTKGDQEFIKNSNLLELKPSKHGNEHVSPLLEKESRSSKLLNESKAEKGTEGGDKLGDYMNILNTKFSAVDTKFEKAVSEEEENRARVELVDGLTIDPPSWDDDTEGPIRFPDPKSDSLPSPSFVAKACDGESSDMVQQPLMPKAETLHGSRSKHNETDRTRKSRFGFCDLGAMENEFQGTHRPTAFCEGDTTFNRRRQAEQQQTSQNGRHHHRRQTRSVHEKHRNGDNGSKYRSHSRRRRHRNQNQRSRDPQNIRGRQWQSSRSADGIRNSLACVNELGGDAYRQLCGPNESAVEAEEWQVICYRKPMQKRRSWRSPMGSAGREQSQR